MKSFTYVTFGQQHVHDINGVIFDKDCVAAIHCDSAADGRSKAFEIFNDKFCLEYHESEFNFARMVYFPRGIIEVC